MGSLFVGCESDSDSGYVCKDTEILTVNEAYKLLITYIKNHQVQVQVRNDKSLCDEI